MFTPQKIYHLHRSICCIVSFLHWCIYTPQHIPEYDNFYLVCRQNRSLTLPVHCNTCRMEYLDPENLSICVCFFFQIFNLPWTFMSSPFIGSVTSFSNSCDSTSFQIFLYLDTNSSASVFIALCHTITKYIFRRLDKQWHWCFIYLITYDIARVLSIIA